jgi:hypothetical protein
MRRSSVRRDAGADLGMPAPDLVKNGDRPQTRNAFE